MTGVSTDQIQSVIDFASHLAKSLQQCQIDLPEHSPDGYLYLNILPFDAVNLSKTQKTSIRDAAILIWNRCNTASTTASTEQQAYVARLRTFAYFLLASLARSKPSNGNERLIQNTITVARECLHANLLDLAKRILESDVITSTYLTVKNTDEGRERLPCVAEYHCLRLLLAWKQERKDLAEHWYSQFVRIISILSAIEIEKMVDLLYEIVIQSLKMNDICIAMSWSSRAVGLVESEELSPHFERSELKLVTLHLHVQILSNSFALEDQTRAESILGQLRSEYGAKLPILALTLEWQRKNPNIDPIDMASTLREMILTAHIIESNHQLIMHFIYCLHERNSKLGIQSLKSYIIDRLVREADLEWLEKAIVCHVNLLCRDQSAGLDTMMDAFQEDLSKYHNVLQADLTACAAQAIHVLIWKMVLHFEEQDELLKAILWCQIGLHPLLEPAGEANKGRFERQLISYHLAMSNLENAREILDGLSLIQKNNGKSRYLAYCIALRSEDDAEAQSCLNTMTNGQGESDQILFACAGESLKHGKLLDTARILQRLFDKHCHSASPPIDLDIVLQCCATVLLKFIEDAGNDARLDQDTIRRICNVFRHVMKRSKQSAGTKGNSKSSLRVRQLARQCFGVATAHLKSWPKQYLIDLLHYSIELDSMHEHTEDGLASEYNSRRRREAEYLQAVLYAFEAQNFDPTTMLEDMPRTAYDPRSAPTISEFRLTLYQNVFKHYSTLKRHYETRTLSSTKEEWKDMLDHIHLLLPLAFEALLFMKANDYLSNEGLKFDEMGIMQVLGAAGSLGVSTATYALFADLVLTFACNEAETRFQLNGLQIPALSAARLLGTIIQTLRESQSYKIDQAARWIRCVVQLVIEEIEKGMNASKQQSTKLGQYYKDQCNRMLATVIEEAINLAKMSLKSDSSATEVDMVESSETDEQRYPEEELQWLAIRIFNLAVDFSAQSREEAGRWAATAVGIAELLHLEAGSDGVTSLVAVLRGKIAELRLI